MRRDLPVMLFTAGFGKRMAPLTDRLPKPLIPVAGKPLIAHSLELVRAAGLTRIVANTHYLADQMADYLAKADVTEIFEPEILDTGGGLKNALPALGHGPVITMNTDAVWTGATPFPALLQAWQPDRMDALLVLVPISLALGHTGAGDFSMTADGRLERGRGYVYSGLQILNADRLAEFEIDKFSLNLLWDRIAAEGRLFGLVHTGKWCDVGRPDSIALAESMLDYANV